MICVMIVFFFFKQKTAYEMRISDWSSDVCSSDLRQDALDRAVEPRRVAAGEIGARGAVVRHEERVADEGDRKSVVSGKSVSVRVDLGGRRIIKKKIISNIKY